MGKTIKPQKKPSPTLEKFTAADLRALPDDKAQEILTELGPAKLEVLKHNWEFWARPQQLEPEGKDWNTWFINAGRGFGKTRAGVEWVRQKVKQGHKRICAVAATNSDIERVMVKGESGFLSVCWKGDKTIRGAEMGYPEYSPTKRALVWKNGAQVQFFSAEEPERLRGPQFEFAWCFVKGTKILTSGGEISVDKVVKGDRVVTRLGLKEVQVTSRRKCQVGRVSFSNGSHLTGTYDHPILTQRGWVELGQLKGYDTCVTTASNGMESVGTPTTAGITNTEGLEVGAEKIETGYTERSGSTTLGKYLSGWTYIIKTVTSLTTAQLTSKFCQGQTTCATTGMANKSQGQLIPQMLTRFLARIVGNLLGENSRSRPCVRLVRKEEATKNVPQFVIADIADKSSILSPELYVASVVSTWQPKGRQYVYNLKVGGQPEYFANGVLTHNCDELAAWNKDMDTWDMLQFCMRLGRHPRIMITTTPKPTKLVRKVLKDPKTIVTSGSTFDNADNLAKTYLTAVKAQYEGTRLGKQELYAEVLEEAEGALWTTDMLDACQVDRKDLPQLSRVVVAIDPAITANAESDMTGIVVAGIDVNGIVYILGDYTEKLSPQGWASKAISLYHQHEADRIVAEKNQGGDMVRRTLEVEDETVPIKLVHAARGKMARAEPISALYERGLVKHVRNPEDGANLEELETQMRTWNPLGSIGSPDRLDACCWSVTELALGSYQQPTMRLLYQNNKGLL